MTAPPRDPWGYLSDRTTARIGLGRAGASLPTNAVLSFALAHAKARDAVHACLDRVALADGLATMGLATVMVESEAVERALYLRRPDLGRRLNGSSRMRLASCASGYDLALAIGDGLSASAVNAHALTLITAFVPFATRLGLTLGPITLAEGARVALGDEIGAALGARVVAVVIGERPGLSAADSLGVYLTYDPKPGRHDAERNCISNIRPDGLSPEAAASKLAWLIDAALTRKLTGVALKDESDFLIADSQTIPEITANEG